MSSVNKVILIGNAGKDPEVRYTPSGAAVCSLSLATSRSWKDKNSGDKVEETEWHCIVFYDRLAEVVGEYINKGSKIYIEGRLKTRKWQDKDGKDMYTTEIVAEQLQMLSPREQGGGQQGSAPRQQQRQQGEPPRQQGRQRQQGNQGGQGRQSNQRQQGSQGNAQGGDKGYSTGFDDMDNDIPFDN